MLCVNEKVVALILVFLFLILLREYFRKKLLIKYSERYRMIIELNNKIKLDFFTENMEFNKSYKSKSALDRADTYNAAIQYVEENFYYIKDYVRRYKECQNQYYNYHVKYCELLTQKINYDDLQYNKFCYFSLKDFIKCENLICKNAMIKNKNYLSLYVNCYYISPKGRNHWYKNNNYYCNDLEKIISIINDKNDYMKTAKYQRTIMTDSLRYDVFKRDNYCCQICGASRKDGVKLEVDHIIPVSRGGKTELNNLQTLCERCNRGKRNKM